MSDSKRNIVERFHELSGPQKIGLVVGSVFVIGIAALLAWPASSDYKRGANINEPLQRAELLTPRGRDRTVEQLSGELTQQGRTLENLSRRLDRRDQEQKLILNRLDEALKGLEFGAGDGGVSEEILDQLRTLRERVESVEAQSELGGGVSLPAPGYEMGTVPGLAPEPFLSASEPNKSEPPKIMVVGGQEEAPAPASSGQREPAPYLTANSMFEGQLLNGMDAPTDQSAKQNAVPAVIRIKSEAILPNLFNVPNIQECFISVAGYGDMADERAKMRTETLSCVVPGKRPGDAPSVIEAKVDGYVVGEDGRVGMRGRLVSKQGQLIAKTMLAGVLSGLGDALRPQSIQGLDINPSGRVETQRYDAGTIAESGLAQGLSDTARSVSQYYLKLADQMMPVVEIDAGRKVTVVLLKGVELK